MAQMKTMSERESAVRQIITNGQYLSGLLTVYYKVQKSLSKAMDTINCDILLGDRKCCGFHGSEMFNQLYVSEGEQHAVAAQASSFVAYHRCLLLIVPHCVNNDELNFIIHCSKNIFN